MRIGALCPAFVYENVPSAGSSSPRKKLMKLSDPVVR
jgi:hypothetical protein